MTAFGAASAFAKNRRMLPPKAVWTVATAAVAVLALDNWWPVARPAESLFVASAALAIGAAISLIVRRLLVTVVTVGSTIAILRTASAIKQDVTNLPLHAYDLVTLFTSPQTMIALWQEHRVYALALITAPAIVALLSAVAWRYDSTLLSRPRTLAFIPVFAALSWSGTVIRGERPHDEVFWDDNRIAFFFASWTETLEALWRGQVIEASVRASDKPFAVPARCELNSKPPHILLIHQESVVQPSLFPELSYDKSLDPFFHSHDGKLHKLRVETYGGASWVTEFSVLSGLSAQSSGGLRNVLQSVMAGKVRETLPQALARCNYRNVVIYPMLRIFLSIDRFFAAAGIHQIVDAKDQGAQSAMERDRFYYANALEIVERHLQSSQQPLFMLVETMTAHGSYDFVYMPEENVPGGGPGTPPRMNEYLRRLAMAQTDFKAFHADLERRFPGERFLIVQYGDHHPAATAPLLGFDANATYEEVIRSGKEQAFLTYYSVDGIRYSPLPLPTPDVLDVPYLGTMILKAAGLPLSDVSQERLRLLALCEGRYHSCRARGEILRFHRRLIDSGLMDAL